MDIKEQCREFLFRFTGGNESSINYNPYENGSAVETLSFDSALSKLENDVEDMQSFFREYGIDSSKAIEATFNIWENHIVIF